MLQSIMFGYFYCSEGRVNHLGYLEVGLTVTSEILGSNPGSPCGPTAYSTSYCGWLYIGRTIDFYSVED